MAVNVLISQIYALFATNCAKTYKRSPISKFTPSGGSQVDTRGTDRQTNRHDESDKHFLKTLQNFA